MQINKKKTKDPEKEYLRIFEIVTFIIGCSLFVSYQNFLVNVYSVLEIQALAGEAQHKKPMPRQVLRKLYKLRKVHITSGTMCQNYAILSCRRSALGDHRRNMFFLVWY